jgi:hypothetical protein
MLLITKRHEKNGTGMIHAAFCCAFCIRAKKGGKDHRAASKNPNNTILCLAQFDVLVTSWQCTDRNHPLDQEFDSQFTVFGFGFQFGGRGSIPSSTTVDQLVNLKYMDIAGNALTGTVPATGFASSTDLKVLHLDGNVDLVAGNFEPLCNMARRPEGNVVELTADCFSVTNCTCCEC